MQVFAHPRRPDHGHSFLSCPCAQLSAAAHEGQPLPNMGHKLRAHKAYQLPAGRWAGLCTCMQHGKSMQCGAFSNPLFTCDQRVCCDAACTYSLSSDASLPVVASADCAVAWVTVRPSFLLGRVLKHLQDPFPACERCTSLNCALYEAESEAQLTLDAPGMLDGIL